MSMLRRYACVAGIALLLSGWLVSPAAADTALGCDKVIGPTPAGGPPPPPPAEDYLTAPQNLALFKQQLLIYRCKRYDNEVAMVVQEARAWIKLRAAQVSNPAIVLDIDETSLSNWRRIYQDEYYPFPSPCSFTPKCSDKDWQWTEQAPAVEPVLNLYKFAQCIDVASACTKVDVYFVTGRHEGDKYAPKEICPSLAACDPSLTRTPREWTLANLHMAGFTGATDDHLCMRPMPTAGTTTTVCPTTGSTTTSSPEPPVSTYKTNQRIAIEQLGKTIIANIGDQNSDLVGLHAERTFKLPNPFYFIP